MSQEPTDAEWLGDLIEYCENVAGFPQSLSAFSVDNEVVRRFKSIAARLERPAVARGVIYQDVQSREWMLGLSEYPYSLTVDELRAGLGCEPVNKMPVTVTINPAAAAGG